MLINKKQLSADVQYAANRVPVLDSKVAHLEEEVTSVLHYKGTVDTYAELPSSGNKIGDVWNIRQADSEHEIKAGDNVAWNGSDWDVLGGAVDVDNLVTKQDLEDSASFLFPNTAGMKVKRTIEYTLEPNSSHTVYPKLFTIHKDSDWNKDSGVVLFRITGTYQGNSDTIETLVYIPSDFNGTPIMMSRSLHRSASSSRLNDLRLLVPKQKGTYDLEVDLIENGSGYNHEFQLKIEVLKDISTVEWMTEEVYSEYQWPDSYFNVFYNQLFSKDSGFASSKLNIPVTKADEASKAAEATRADYLYQKLQKFIGGQACLPPAKTGINYRSLFYSNGTACTQFNKQEPIDPKLGILLYSATWSVSVGSYPSNWDSVQKYGDTLSLSSYSGFYDPNEVLTQYSALYLRCTMSDGKIYPDKFVTNIIPGYTYYRLGQWNGSNLIFDVAGSYFFTLDEEGRITHIDGIQLAGQGGGSSEIYTTDFTENENFGFALFPTIVDTITTPGKYGILLHAAYYDDPEESGAEPEQSSALEYHYDLTVEGYYSNGIYDGGAQRLYSSEMDVTYKRNIDTDGTLGDWKIDKCPSEKLSLRGIEGTEVNIPFQYFEFSNPFEGNLDSIITIYKNGILLLCDSGNTVINDYYFDYDNLKIIFHVPLEKSDTLLVKLF